MIFFFFPIILQERGKSVPAQQQAEVTFYLWDYGLETKVLQGTKTASALDALSKSTAVPDDVLIFSYSIEFAKHKENKWSISGQKGSP